ncbi:tRNA adenosine(34) deaminase TadA [Nicoletella semolina]|nr:tRNA adenosine(34) deaminase TadA [Nicoletella semolina]MDH2923913.1 tRNA adenosine(34) deaminase TadA [Nicoletella semolina]
MFIQTNEQSCDLELSDRDLYFMKYALSLAKRAEIQGDIPIGAVLVDKLGQVIGEGWNSSILMNDPTAHAEIQAIRQAGQRLGNYRLLETTLYVTLEPCPMCAGAILHSRIGRLVFGTSDYKTGAIGSRFHLFEDYKMNHILKIRGGVLNAQCRQQISQFFQKRRSQKKRLKGARGVYNTPVQSSS